MIAGNRLTLAFINYTETSAIRTERFSTRSRVRAECSAIQTILQPNRVASRRFFHSYAEGNNMRFNKFLFINYSLSVIILRLVQLWNHAKESFASMQIICDFSFAVQTARTPLFSQRTAFDVQEMRCPRNYRLRLSTFEVNSTREQLYDRYLASHA